VTTELQRQTGGAVTQLGEMSVQAIIDRKRKLVEVMQAVMIQDVHYGKIPGCGDKPTLHKAGAEVLATVFGLAPTFVVVEKELPAGHREYRVTCTLSLIGSGTSLGEGVGACSTMESKYRWRKDVSARKCPDCGVGVRKSKDKPEWYCWAKVGGCGKTFALNDDAIMSQQVGESKVENPDPADTYNTVLKMAKKRAQVDATLTAVGASDILTQDLEDLPAASRNDNVEDAEFTTHDTAPKTNRRNPLDDIANAKSLDELQALVPDLSSLKGEPRSRALQAFTARKVELGKVAA
jgi:hypothetical protein